MAQLDQIYEREERETKVGEREEKKGDRERERERWERLPTKTIESNQTPHPLHLLPLQRKKNQKRKNKFLEREREREGGCFLAIETGSRNAPALSLSLSPSATPKIYITSIIKTKGK